MVDTQVRPSDVTKFPIIDAMLSVPREAFLPDSLAEAAYAGEMLDVGGRIVVEPRTFAKMLDALALDLDDVVLDIGCAMGYSSAVLAHMVSAVVGVEDDADRAADAQHRLSRAGVDNAAVMDGPLAEGAAKHGPYDAILIEGGAEEVPAAICDQLKDGGRIVAILMDGALGRVMVGHKSSGDVDWRFAFNATAPVLPGFERARAFQL